MTRKRMHGTALLLHTFILPWLNPKLVAMVVSLRAIRTAPGGVVTGAVESMIDSKCTSWWCHKHGNQGILVHVFQDREPGFIAKLKERLLWETMTRIWNWRGKHLV